MTNQELIPEETIEKKTLLTSKAVTVICEEVREAESHEAAEELIPYDNLDKAGLSRIIKALVALDERLEAEEAKESDRLVKVDASVRWHMTNPFSKWNGTEEECRQAMLKNIK